MIVTKDRKELYIDIECFENKKVIGRGSFGKVYRVEDPENSKIYALKKLMLDGTKEFYASSIHYFLNEINTLSAVKHKCIMNLYGYSISDAKHRLYLLMEYLPTDLDKILKQYNYSDERTINNTFIMKVLIGIIAGLVTLHSHNIIHRDIKPENILLAEDGTPKIGDFGYARFVPDAEKNHKCTNNVGSEAWMAPEVFSGTSYSSKCDIYSFAVIAFQLITRKSIIWEGFKNMDEIVNQNRRMIIPDNFPPAWRELIEVGWSGDPDVRPSAYEIFKMLADPKFLLPGVNVEEVINFYREMESETIIPLAEMTEDPSYIASDNKAFGTSDMFQDDIGDGIDTTSRKYN